MKYYIIQNGQQMGPYTVEQLKLYHVTPETDVWTEGMANWVKAKTVPELATLFMNAGVNAGMGAAGAAYGAAQGFQNQAAQQAQPAQNAGYGGYPPKSWTAEAVLVTLFCCMPFGIVGLVHATMVSLYYNRGEFEAAEQASKTAGKWVKIAFFLGLAIIILYTIFILVVGNIFSEAYRRAAFGY